MKMKKYFVNGDLRWFAEGTQPEGAVPATKKKAAVKPSVKAEPVEAPKVETKARKKPANKARKAGANK